MTGPDSPNLQATAEFKTETASPPVAAAGLSPANGHAGRLAVPPVWLVYAVSAIAVVALTVTLLMWQRLGTIQEQLARQSADTGSQSLEAKGLSRQASDLARETAARVAVIDARLSEVALQRTQLDDLIQSLSRSRDENLVVDIESAIRLAQQQAQMTGSSEPLVAALKTADLRVQRAAQPRLSALARAINRDLARVQSSALADTPGLLVKLDELVRVVDELPLANAVGARSNTPLESSQPMVSAQSAPAIVESTAPWWRVWAGQIKSEARNLLRVNRIENPEAAVLSPEQSFFVRENVKLKLLNARLGLLSRHLEASRADLLAASTTLQRYFALGNPKVKIAAAQMQQLQSQMRMLDIPRVDETLGALTTAAAGR